MIQRDESPIVTTFARFVVPLAQLFGLYVLAHGHYSPGGGFQAGVILGATVMLRTLALGREATRSPGGLPFLALGAAGVLLYLLTGVAGIASGGTFLDYGALPVAATVRRARYVGIFLIETGVAVAVAATLVVIFDRLTDRTAR